MKFIRRSIGLKILITVGILGSVILTGMGMMAVRQMEQALLLQNDQETKRFLDGVSRSLQTIMLAGYADIAHIFADNLQQVEGLRSFYVLRRSGIKAFMDNKTVADVNKRIGEEEFEERSSEKEERVMPEDNPYLQEAVAKVETTSWVDLGEDGRRLITYLVPIHNRKECYRCHGSNHQVRGILRVTTSLAMVEEAIYNARLGLAVLVALAVMSFIIILGVVLRGMVNRPLRRIHRVIQVMAEGNLTDRFVEVVDGDEMATIGTHVNRMADSLVHNIRTINMHAGSITAFVKEILNLRRAIGEDSDRLRQTSSEMVERNEVLSGEIVCIKKDVDESTQTIANISSAAERVHSKIESMAKAAEQAREKVMSMSQEAVRMQDNVEEVNNNLTQVNEALQVMSREMDDMTSSLEGVRGRCREASKQSRGASDNAQETLMITERLAQSAREIGKVTQIIRQIAEKTNLLALNAAIEAAGAGEYGHGFAVVAKEVKELAGQTAEATKSIAGQILGIQNHTAEAAEAVQAISGMVGGILQANEAIVQAVDEQADSILAVGQSIREVSQAAGRVTESGRALGDAAVRVSQSADVAAQGAVTIVMASQESVQEADVMSKSSHQAFLSMESIRHAAEKTELVSQGVRERVIHSLQVVDLMQGSVNHFRSLGDVASNISDALQAAQSSLDIGGEAFDIRAMKEVHLQLLGKLERIANGSMTVNKAEIESQHACVLGRWIQHEVAQPMQQHPMFAELQRTHDQLHQTANEVVGYVEANNKDAAILAVRFFQELRKALFEQLDQLYMGNEPEHIKQNMLCKWTDDLAVGVEELDAHHRQLFEQIGVIYQHLHNNESTKVLVQVLGEWIQAAQHHFKREEEVMADIGYARLEEHRIEHGKMLRQVDEFYTLFCKENLPFSNEILQFMKNWLVMHIRGSDRGYAEWLKERKQ